MLKRIFNFKSNSIASAAIILGAASLASRALGAIRDVVLLRQIGVGDTLDAYYTSFRIPDLIFALVVLGAVSSGLVPVFIDYWRQDKDRAWYLINNIFNIVFS